MECDTEELIKQKAKELYFSKGVFDASTQEIADFAGVNRTLVNYYFRSKKNLFQVVYKETIEKMKEKYVSIYVSDKPFRSKVEDIIEFTIQFKEKYPYLEVFNIQEFNKPNGEDELICIPKGSEELNGFLKEIEEEMEKGTLKRYEPINFFINIFSLISFPMVMKTVFAGLFNIRSDEDIQRIYKQRKEMAMTILFNNKE